jgi:hypothetical protein
MTTPPPAVNPYAAAEAPPTGPNSLARASFIIAIVIVVIAVVMQVVNRLVPQIMYNLALESSQIGLFFAGLAFVNLLLGGLGLVLGLLGARRGDAGLQAGVGIGVGGFVALTSLVSLISTPLVALLA